MKPCMICLYKNETDSAQELWNDMHTLKKTCLSLKKNWKKTIFATETTTCDPWERGKMYSRLEKSNMYDRKF